MTCTRRIQGLTYIEVLVAVLLVAVAMVPAIDALQGGVMSARVHGELVEEHFHLGSRIEELLAQPFSDLDTEALAVGDPTVATAFSDTLGATRRRLVFLARYDGDDVDGDGDPFTGGDDGLLWVRVEIESTNQSLETLTSR